MLCLYLEAPFAAFRSFTAGSFRPTASFITPSAAYGLLLNLAGVEMRADEGKEMTTIKKGLPVFKLALGALSLPRMQSLYQQLHNYPVGNSGKKNSARARGAKYNIVPVRRSFMSDIKAYICLDGNEELAERVLQGLAGKIKRAYGLPFLGDNSFLISRLEPREQPEPAYWWERVDPEKLDGLEEDITRLTIAIDRQDMSRTSSDLFAPSKEKALKIPSQAWVQVGYP